MLPFQQQGIGFLAAFFFLARIDNLPFEAAFIGTSASVVIGSIPRVEPMEAYRAYPVAFGKF